MDAVGIALLRVHGTVPAVADGPVIFQDQIARAAALGVGIRSADQIRLVPLDKRSGQAAEQIRQQLDR